MSRDWTPEQAYLVEQHNIKNGLGSWWDFLESATWSVNGKTWLMHSQESLQNRRKFPLLGRLYNGYDKLYARMNQISGGMDLLSRLEKELDTYVTTGEGNKDSYVLKWFTGTLDEGFYYSTRNDEKFMTAVMEDLGRQYRCDPTSGRCFWFAISEDKCFSAWYAPDPHDGDQLQMKLEQRAEDGSMGPHCQLIFDESYGTADTSYKAIRETICEIYEDAGVESPSDTHINEITDQVMSVFGLKKKGLEDQIKDVENKKGPASSPEKSQIHDLEH